MLTAVIRNIVTDSSAVFLHLHEVNFAIAN